jgi:hypothetical protein
MKLIMKPLQILVNFAAAALLAVPLMPALAQSQLSARNGIAASPKVQQMLSERTAFNIGSATGAATVSDKACCQVACCGDAKSITASPKVHKMLAERNANSSCNNNKQPRYGAIASVTTCVKCCN